MKQPNLMSKLAGVSTDLMASASSTDIDQVFAQLEEKVKAFAEPKPAEAQ